MDFSINGIISQIMDALNQGGILGQFTFFSVVTLTEVGIPFPYLLDSGVFLTSFQSGPISVAMFRIFLVVFLGRQCGAAIVYWLTRWLGGTLIRWLEKRFNSVRKNLDRFSARLSNQAYMTVAGARLTGLLTLVSMAAGACKIRYVTFFIGVTLSALIFDGSLVLLGWITRQGFRFFRVTPPLWAVIVGFIVVIAVVWVVRFFFFTDKRSRPDPT